MKGRLLPILGMVVIMVGIIFLTGIATVLLVPQLVAMFEFFGFDAGDPNVWDIYLAMMVLFVAPLVVLFVFAIRGRPK